MTGDRRRGKLFRGSHGKTRPQVAKKAGPAAGPRPRPAAQAARLLKAAGCPSGLREPCPCGERPRLRPRPSGKALAGGRERVRRSCAGTATARWRSWPTGTGGRRGTPGRARAPTSRAWRAAAAALAGLARSPGAPLPGPGHRRGTGQLRAAPGRPSARGHRPGARGGHGRRSCDDGNGSARPAQPRVVQRGWGEVDLEREGWAGAFDLVFASMSPGVDGPEAWSG